MNFSNTWNEDPRDKMSRDEVIMAWQKSKEALTSAKEDEMSWRKYVVSKAWDNPVEGTNTLDLGNGYQLKGKVKYNYNLADNDTVWAGLDELSKTGNDGGFIADRLVSWTPNFLLTEYRKIEEEAENGSEIAKKQLFIISKFMTKKEAAPELEIKEPKGKRK